mgnify:CR=1 FL=1|tara:strand:+ start:497 stop:1021 length:525 start_codon:yes stop_codon:yes gene_type:complete
MKPPHLSITEYAVLGILASRPNHGFALSKELGRNSDVGKIFTVRRPLVYRALNRLVDAGYAEPVATEKGTAGPQRVIRHATLAGRERLKRWLEEPEEHIRDLRIGFLLKLALLLRAQRSPMNLIKKQRRVLDDTLLALESSTTEPTDHVELWRLHNATAAVAYLDELEGTYTEN